MEFCMESPLLEMPCRRLCLMVSYLRISQKRMQRMVSTGKSETFDGMGVTEGCEREQVCKVGTCMAGK